MMLVSRLRESRAARMFIAHVTNIKIDVLC